MKTYLALFCVVALLINLVITDWEENVFRTDNHKQSTLSSAGDYACVPFKQLKQFTKNTLLGKVSEMIEDQLQQIVSKVLPCCSHRLRLETTCMLISLDVIIRNTIFMVKPNNFSSVH